MITSREFQITALAIATAWRCPPDSEATGWRIDRTVVTESPASVSRGRGLHVLLVEERKWVRSRPRNMFWTMSRLSQSARSWYTVSIPRRPRPWASGCTGLALPQDLAAVGLMDAGDRLISTDLPAPLSPTSAVTCPAGISRVDVDQRVHRAEALVESAQLEQRRRPSPSTSTYVDSCGCARCGERTRRTDPPTLDEAGPSPPSTPCSSVSTVIGVSSTDGHVRGLVVRSCRSPARRQAWCSARR